MFEQVSNFFGNVKNFFADGIKTIKDGIRGAYDKVTGGVSNVVGTVYTDLKSIVSGSGDIVKQVVNRGADNVEKLISGTENVIKHGQDTIGGTVSSLGNSLSMPLLLLGGAAAFYMLKMKA